MNMKFSIWYNQTAEFPELIDKYKDNISSIYFALPLKFWTSWRHLVQEKNYEKNIFELIQKCKKYWIETILVVNATCEWENTWDKEYLKKIIKYLKKLLKLWLKSISLTNLLYVKFIKKSIPELIIYSSVNCYVKTLEHAMFLKKIWVDIITIDRDINRDLPLIKKIKEKTGLPIQILLNEWCIRNCPFRQTHFNIISHQLEDNEINKQSWRYNLIERFSCYPLLVENKKMIFRVPFIRPEDLHYYDWICDIFKLTTRDNPIEEIELMLSSYIKWYYHWNLFDIIPSCIWNREDIVKSINNDKLTELDFFNDIKKCPWDCDSCNNCDKYFN